MIGRAIGQLVDRHARRHDSVFVKLVVVMVTTAVCLVAVVSAFAVVMTREIHPLMSAELRAAAHRGLLVLTLLVTVGVVVVAHLVLRRLLRPLRALGDGVARLGGGELGVRLPRTTRDEFGQLTDGFNDMAARVRDMVVARERLLVDVSHELRSPLARMKVALALLPDDRHRARLADDVTEMERLVAELLELERLRTPRGIAATRGDLIPIVREVADRYLGVHPGVRVAAPEGVAAAEVDGAKVRMVLRNLLDNAVKHAVPDSAPITVSVHRADDAVVVRVADDGHGVPAGEAARLFEPFYRADRSRSKDTGGYGLGLSICQRVMEAHAGTIVVEAWTGRGATFVLRFPSAS